MSRIIKEIREQPEALRRTVAALERDQMLLALPERWQAQTVLLTGMGSSLAAAHYGAYLLTQRGFHAIAIDTSDLLYYQLGLLNARPLLVVISQSGRSVEVCKLLDIAAGHLPILGITNTLDSPVARLSTAAFHLHAGEEHCASTKTYTCTLAALYLLAGALCGTLPDSVAALEQASQIMAQTLPLWAEQARAASRVVSGKHSLICIGRGPAYCTASAAELLFQEIAKLPARSIAGGAFRHGPLEALSDTVGYVMIEGLPVTRDLDRALAREMVASISPARDSLIWVGQGNADAAFTMPVSTEDGFIQPILAIVPLQLLAFEVARQRGVEPDKYHFAQKVTIHKG